MTRINVNITTAAGYDTKYLFPGAVPHLSTGHSIYSATHWRYRLDIIKEGHNQDGLGNSFSFDLYGSSLVAVGRYDISGLVNTWDVRDARESGTEVGAIGIWNDSNTSPSDLQVSSFSMITPDAIMASQSLGTLKFFFSGYRGNDTLRGSFWHDELDGGKGADSMIGGDGDDKYTVDNKKDKVVELKGEGKDTVVTTINYTLSSNLENLSSNGSRDLTLVGNAKANSVSGSNGDDTVKGLDGNDSLLGNLGNDVLYGGKGRDQFYFMTAPSKSNVDTVKDFSHKDDFIWISQFAHPGLTDLLHPVSLSQLPETAFYSSKSGKAHDDNDRILYDKDDGKLYFDADGDGTAYSRQLIANFTGHPTIGAENILIL